MGVNKGFTNAYERLYNKGLSNPDHEGQKLRIVLTEKGRLRYGA
jgi:uncharacterized protein YwgA